MANRPGKIPPGVVLRSSWGEPARRFAQAVREARRTRQMSTAALAEQCCVSQRDIVCLERAYPADPQAAAAVARNLALPPPDLEADPVYRAGLILLKRRKRARLSLSQLARLSGLGIQTLIRIERGQCWPRRRSCAALLSVAALELRPEDFAEFTRQPPTPAPRDGSPPPAPRELPPPASELLAAPPAPTPPADLKQLAFTVRVYTDGTLLFEPGRSLRP